MLVRVGVNRLSDREAVRSLGIASAANTDRKDDEEDKNGHESFGNLRGEVGGVDGHGAGVGGIGVTNGEIASRFGKSGSIGKGERVRKRART